MVRVFDRIARFDERSRQYPIRALISKRPARKDKRWAIGPILDQGSEGACVGFGWAAEALAAPVPVDLQRLRFAAPREPNGFARQLYLQSKIMDEYDGENYDGSSVLGGAKAMQSYGLLREYRWAFGLDDVVDAVLAKGPVVLGINWYEGMYEAPGGVLRPTGPVVGGHCITIVGYRHQSELLAGGDGVLLQNSWGSRWGVNGLALLALGDLEKLLAANGEACIPSRRSYGR